MHLVTGINHVAVLTEDLDRFVNFYREVFELDLVFEETTPAFRHAILRIGPDSWLHPAEVAGSPDATASAAQFARGHLDHLGLTAPSAEAFAAVRSRLLARGASDGAVDDLGAFHSLWFVDPDGLQVELVVVVDASLGDIHAPRPLERAPA